MAGYDGGDCCSCTCDPNGYYDCGGFRYACIDPEAACVDDDDITEAIASSCIPEYISDGLCDPENNIEICGMCWRRFLCMIVALLARLCYHLPCETLLIVYLRACVLARRLMFHIWADACNGEMAECLYGKQIIAVV